MKMYHVKKFLNFEYSVREIVDYFLAYFRYAIFNTECDYLIRTHIREQIAFRIRVMDDTCFLSGSCKICGCNTPELQMANKSCEGNCYPKMMGRKQWKNYKIENSIKDVGKL